MATGYNAVLTTTALPSKSCTQKYIKSQSQTLRLQIASTVPAAHVIIFRGKFTPLLLALGMYICTANDEC